MPHDHLVQNVPGEYPEEYQPKKLIPWKCMGLSGASHRLFASDAGLVLLRSLPESESVEHQIERLKFRQAVQWHAVSEGLEIVPLPIETREHRGYVQLEGRIWELLPWIHGEQDVVAFEEVPGHPGTIKIDAAIEPYRIVSAMMSLGQFHEASRYFPLPNSPQEISPSIYGMKLKWERYLGGELRILEMKIRGFDRNERFPFSLFELRRHGLEIIRSAEFLGCKLLTLLEEAARISVPLQPVLRNADRRHLIFDDEGVCGIIDFKELDVDNIALDLAMLLGSICGREPGLRQLGLSAYQSIRPLEDRELALFNAFEIADMLFPVLEHLEEIFIRKRNFEKPQLDIILDELRWGLHCLQNHCFGHSRFAA